MTEFTEDFIERASELFVRKNAMTREEFDELSAIMRARAFTVAYISAVDDILYLQNLLDKAITDGTRLEEFRVVAREYLSKPWHIETVFRTNVQTAYGAARWQAVQKLRSLRPYGQYRAVLDGRSRPKHAALHGKTYSLDHEFWQTYWPPWDYNCRCHVVTLTQSDIESEKITPEIAMPGADLQPSNDFVSPAKAGLTLDPYKLLAERADKLGNGYSSALSAMDRKIKS